MNIYDIKERIKEIDKNLQNINDCYNSESPEDDFDIIGEVCGISNEENLIKEKNKLLISLKELEKERDLKTFKKGIKMETNKLKKYCFKQELSREDYGSITFVENREKCVFARNKKEAKEILERELTENWFDLI